MSNYLKYFNTHSEYQTYITGSDKILPNVSYCADNNEVHYSTIVKSILIAKFNVTDTINSTKIIHSTTGISEIVIDDVKQSEVINNYTFDTTGEHIIKYTLLDPTTISSNTFQQCLNLISITIPNTVTTIGGSAFGGCSNLTNIIMSDSVTTIGDAAFGATGITNITLPNTLTTIGLGMFNECTSLTTVNSNINGECIIPNNVTSIGVKAFYKCNGITSVTIPDSVTSISNQCFGYCSGITSITSLATTAPTITSDVFRNIKTDGTLYVPNGSTGYDTWMGTGSFYLGSYNWTKVEQ